MEYLLTTDQLTKQYGGAKALNQVSLGLPKGQIVGLLGPNGSGKTTFIKLCAGLLKPTRGSISICAEEIGTGSKSLVSYLPDRTYLNNRQKIRDQLDFFEDFYEDFDRSRAERMLRDLGLSPQTRFGTLSKGAKEKVQLVLVMSRRARLYLLDEPIGGVDPATRDYILQTIIANRNPESTVLISTHLIADVEPILDGFIFLNRGMVVQSGMTAAVREDTGKSLDEIFREVFRCLPNC